MNKLLLTLTFLLLGAPSAIAVDLVNRDSKSYEVRVTSNGKSFDTSIDAATVINNICSSSCRIEVKGVDSIQATQNQTVVIENGSLKR